MKAKTKEEVQYATAIGGFVSGILMCFLSFFMNNYTIAGSVLAYMGEMIILLSGVFGLSVYVKTQLLEAQTRMDEKIEKKFEELEEENAKDGGS